MVEGKEVGEGSEDGTAERGERAMRTLHWRNQEYHAWRCASDWVLCVRRSGWIGLGTKRRTKVY